MSARTAAIRAEGVTKLYPGPLGRDIAALGPLDLTIEAGEFLCIIGPSGCGKSTFLRLVAGLERPTAGSLTLQSPPADRPLTATMFQGDSTFPWLTVFDNVEYGLRMRGQPIGPREQRVTELLEVVGLSRFAAAYPYQLSGGMRQRVALARALANDPAILLMDEPFGAVDEQTRLLLQEELLRLWEQTDKTVLFITHSIDEALTLGDRVLLMSAAPGRILAEYRVPFPRPREVVSLKRDPAFGDLSVEIWSRLRDEVNAARREEGMRG